MKRAEWTKTALNVGIPYTDVPMYVLAPLVPTFFFPGIIPFYVKWPIGLALCGWLIYLNRVKRRTPGWLLRRLRSKFRQGIYHARPLWLVRRMSRPTSPQWALSAALDLLRDEDAAFGFAPTSAGSPAVAEQRRPKAAPKTKPSTDQSKRKTRQ